MSNKQKIKHKRTHKHLLKGNKLDVRKIKEKLHFANAHEAISKLLLPEFIMTASGGVVGNVIKGNELKGMDSPFLKEPLLSVDTSKTDREIVAKNVFIVRKRRRYKTTREKRQKIIHTTFDIDNQEEVSITKAFTLAEVGDTNLDLQEILYRWQLAAIECLFLHNLPSGLFPALKRLFVENKEPSQKMVVWIEMECVGRNELFTYMSKSKKEKGVDSLLRIFRDGLAISSDIIHTSRMLAHNGWLFFDSKPSNWVVKLIPDTFYLQTRPVDAGATLLVHVKETSNCKESNNLLEWINLFFVAYNLLLCEESVDTRLLREILLRLKQILYTQLSKDAGLLQKAVYLLNSLCHLSHQQTMFLYCPVDLMRKYTKHWGFKFKENWHDFFAMVLDKSFCTPLSTQVDFCVCHRLAKK